MSTPTLDDLFAKFRYLLKDPEFTDYFEKYFRLVASRVRKPLLYDNKAVLAAQCVIIILEHVKKMEEEQGLQPTKEKIPVKKSLSEREKELEFLEQSKSKPLWFEKFLVAFLILAVISLLGIVIDLVWLRELR